MSRLTMRSTIRVLIAIAAISSIVLPSLTLQLEGVRGTVDLDVSLGEAVTSMIDDGEWIALGFGAAGTFIMTEVALAFDERKIGRIRWLFAIGTLLALVFTGRLLSTYDSSLGQASLAGGMSLYLSFGLIIPIGCFLCMTVVVWHASLHPSEELLHSAT